VFYLAHEFQHSPEPGLNWVRSFKENEVMLEWMRETLPKDQVVVATNPALVHLYTGHKTVGFDDPAANWETWNHINVRYLARLSVTPVPNPDPDESRYDLVYRSRGELNLRVIDFGPTSSRLAWGKAHPRVPGLPGRSPDRTD
jgi:hypothetical protein